MPALLRLSASLRNLLGGKDEFVIEPGKCVRETLVSLNIKPELVALVTVNGEMQTKDYLIQEGDTVRILAVVGGG